MNLLQIICVLVFASQSYAWKSANDWEDDLLEIVAEWPLLEYGFPSERHRDYATLRGWYNSSSGRPTDVAPFIDAYGKRNLIVAIPRFSVGIPYSLAIVTDRLGPNGAPLLEAYPSYAWNNHMGENCDSITSAFRVSINECQQMWVIDSGVINEKALCPPQLLLFDLNTRRFLHRHRFSKDVYIPRASLFNVPLAVVRDPPPKGDCRDTVVYVTDVTYNALVVYDFKTDKSWRIQHRFMFPDPDHGIHTIAGRSFTLMDGIFTMATDKKNLYFHPLASLSEYSVPLDHLNNFTYWQNNDDSTEFKQLGQRESQCAAEAIDSKGNLYCATFNPVRLMSSNVALPYQKQNFRYVPIDPKYIEFVAGMKVVKDFNGQDELWMVSNRVQIRSIGPNEAMEVNFRILRRSLVDMHQGL